MTVWFPIWFHVSFLSDYVEFIVVTLSLEHTFITKYYDKNKYIINWYINISIHIWSQKLINRLKIHRSLSIQQKNNDESSWFMDNTTWVSISYIFTLTMNWLIKVTVSHHIQVQTCSLLVCLSTHRILVEFFLIWSVDRSGVTGEYTYILFIRIVSKGCEMTYTSLNEKYERLNKGLARYMWPTIPSVLFILLLTSSNWFQ